VKGGRGKLQMVEWAEIGLGSKTEKRHEPAMLAVDSRPDVGTPCGYRPLSSITCSTSARGARAWHVD